MARKARAEVEGGLYHVIVRGNNRRRVFDSAADYEKLLSLLAAEEARREHRELITRRMRIAELQA